MFFYRPKHAHGVKLRAENSHTDMKFGFYYNKEDSEDTGKTIKKAFSKLKSLEGTKLHWRLVYPDNTCNTWEGKPTVYMNGGNTGEAMSWNPGTQR